MKLLFLSAAVLIACIEVPLFATGYGSLNNFDCVNDNEEDCHGFEIEIEDLESRDITYTYDYNHYGTPRIIQDNSNPVHPRTIIRYESRKNPDGTWAAYTAVPSGPISPTDGHQFTNPNVNFGGEHFGAGFSKVPTSVMYHWLIDNGNGELVHGTAVNIATPTFTYRQNVGAAAQVQAEIEPPPEPHIKEFGEPNWVKEIRTETHNNNRVELRDLVSDDPDDPDDENWTNGEPDEVETEWQLLQREFNKADGGANGEHMGAPEDLPNGDEIITRRYEFFKYIGPIDEENGEAKAERVGPDGIHGEGIKEINGVEIDLSTIEVVGEYIGAQMAGFDALGQLGVIDNLQEAEKDVPYVERRIVIEGIPPVTIEFSGELPEGMDFDTISGVLSGTPRAAGTFNLSIHTTDASGADLTGDYALIVNGEIQPQNLSDVWSID